MKDANIHCLHRYMANDFPSSLDDSLASFGGDEDTSTCEEDHKDNPMVYASNVLNPDIFPLSPCPARNQQQMAVRYLIIIIFTLPPPPNAIMVVTTQTKESKHPCWLTQHCNDDTLFGARKSNNASSLALMSVHTRQHGSTNDRNYRNNSQCKWHICEQKWSSTTTLPITKVLYSTSLAKLQKSGEKTDISK